MTVDLKELKKRLKDASAQVGSGWSSVSRGGTECPFSGIKVKNDRNENAAAEIKVCFDQMIQADLTEDEIGKVLSKSLIVELLKSWAPEAWNGLANLLAGKDRLRSILSHEVEKVLRNSEKKFHNEPFLLAASGFETARLVAENTRGNTELVFEDQGLTPETAKGLSYFKGRLAITVVENFGAMGPATGTLSSDSIEALANHEGTLILELGEINVETATALSSHNGPLEITCAEWSDESLIALSKLENDLTLWDVSKLSDEAAMWLSKRTGVLNFYGQTPPYDSTLVGHLALLESQVKNNPHDFSIRLANLDPKIARILSKHGKGGGEHLRIDVESIDEECAQILSGHEGTLYLEELKDLSDEAVKALANHHAENIHWADEDSKSYPFISFSTYEMASRIKDFRKSLNQEEQDALMKTSASQEIAEEIDLWSFLRGDEQIIVIASCDVKNSEKLVWLDQDTLEAKEELTIPLKLRRPDTKWTKDEWLDNGKLIADEWRRLLSFAKGSSFKRFGPGMGWGGQAGKMVGEDFIFTTNLHNRIKPKAKFDLMVENGEKIISKRISGTCSGIWEHDGEIGVYVRRCLEEKKFKWAEPLITKVENSIQFFKSKNLKPSRPKVQLGITEVNEQVRSENSHEFCIDMIKWGWACVGSVTNQILISQGVKKQLEVLDGITGEKIRQSEAFESCITMIAVSPDESEIAVALLDQIIILDFETLKPKSSIPFSGDFSPSTSQEEVVYMEYISDGSLLIFGRTEEEINYETVLKKRVILCKDPASEIPSFCFAGQKSVG